MFFVAVAVAVFRSRARSGSGRGTGGSATATATATFDTRLLADLSRSCPAAYRVADEAVERSGSIGWDCALPGDRPAPEPWKSCPAPPAQDFHPWKSLHDAPDPPSTRGTPTTAPGRRFHPVEALPAPAAGSHFPGKPDPRTAAGPPFHGKPRPWPAQDPLSPVETRFKICAPSLPRVAMASGSGAPGSARRKSPRGLWLSPLPPVEVPSGAALRPLPRFPRPEAFDLSPLPRLPG